MRLGEAVHSFLGPQKAIRTRPEGAFGHVLEILQTRVRNLQWIKSMVLNPQLEDPLDFKDSNINYDCCRSFHA